MNSTENQETAGALLRGRFNEVDQNAVQQQLHPAREHTPPPQQALAVLLQLGLRGLSQGSTDDLLAS